MKIDIDNVDTDIAGEILRNLVFVQQKRGDHKELGCYSTFETQSDFKRICPQEDQYEFIYKHLDIDDEDLEILNPFAFENQNIVVMWCWDGDGTLVIYPKNGSKIYINDDCKKTYGWKCKKVKKQE